jgi:hypothetical protein
MIEGAARGGRRRRPAMIEVAARRGVVVGAARG